MARKPGDESLIVRIFMSRQLSEYQTAQQGRDVYTDVETIQILVPGARDAIVRDLTLEDRERFADDYKAFKLNLNTPVEGTPLEEWPGISADLVENLKQVGIRSVEQLSEAQDAVLTSIPGGANAKVRALANLDFIAGMAATTAALKERDDLKIENGFLKSQVAKLQSDYEKAMADLEKLTEPKPDAKTKGE